MNSLLDITCCQLCPRTCKVNRTVSTGFCSCTNEVKAARAALHLWEEPCIAAHGSGTVFFSGCTLKCCFAKTLKSVVKILEKHCPYHSLVKFF